MSHLTGPEQPEVAPWKVVAWIVIFVVVMAGLAGGGFFYDLAVWFFAIVLFLLLVAGIAWVCAWLVRHAVRR